MKKILSIGVLSAIALPLITTISCGLIEQSFEQVQFDTIPPVITEVDKSRHIRGTKVINEFSEIEDNIGFITLEQTSNINDSSIINQFDIAEMVRAYDNEETVSINATIDEKSTFIDSRILGPSKLILNFFDSFRNKSTYTFYITVNDTTKPKIVVDNFVGDFNLPIINGPTTNDNILVISQNTNVGLNEIKKAFHFQDQNLDTVSWYLSDFATGQLVDEIDITKNGDYLLIVRARDKANNYTEYYLDIDVDIDLLQFGVVDSKKIPDLYIWQNGEGSANLVLWDEQIPYLDYINEKDLLEIIKPVNPVAELTTTWKDMPFDPEKAGEYHLIITAKNSYGLAKSFDLSIFYDPAAKTSWEVMYSLMSKK